ncbi:hypothetical protein QAD02_016410 [Eretmocerus hayati]|uniref:Uncharacterized protein n=1 Tax=Eretmocerus hayati TaxID=131215 RepID=A0ACC2PBZ9_9HYME|nr:hypothetical protein QAD02_016410 [Eretmocerus hayati]
MSTMLAHWLGDPSHFLIFVIIIVEFLSSSHHINSYNNNIKMERRKPFSSLSKRQQDNRLNYISCVARNESIVVPFSNSSLSNLERQPQSFMHSNILSERASSGIERTVTIVSNHSDLVTTQSIESDHHITHEFLADSLKIGLENSERLNHIDDFENSDDIENARENFFNVDSSQHETYEVLPSLDLATDIARWACQHEVTMSALGGLLKLLRRRANDDFESLPLDPRSLMKTSKNVKVVLLGVGEFTHYGLEKAMIEQLRAVGATLDSSVIYFDLFGNGSPIFNSRNLSLLALLGKIVHPLFIEPFFISGYYGKEKAPNVHEFVAPFVIEYARLERDGLLFDGVRYSIKLRCVIADTIARNWLLEHPAHNCIQGCLKCLVIGFKIGGATTFPDLDAPLKNDEEFRSSLPLPYKLGVSPLEWIGVRLYSQVPLEVMHQGDLGLTERLVKHWMSMFGGGVGALEISSEFSESYKALAQCVPDEFPRKPRGMDELSYFKATDFRLILLYTGPPAIRRLLSHEHIVHFNALNCAWRILSDPEFCLTLNSQADMLLRYFVKNVETLYGREHVVFCVHSAIHLAADVMNFGALERFSAYPFESFLGYLRSLVR